MSIILNIALLLAVVYINSAHLTLDILSNYKTMQTNLLASLILLAFCISFINAKPLSDDSSDDLDEELLSERLLEMLSNKREYVANKDGYLTGGDGLRYYTRAGPDGSRIVFRIDVPGITLPKDGLFLIPRDGLRDLIKSTKGSLA